MSGLHSELAAGSAPGCKVCAFIDGLTPSEQAEWNVELALPIKVVGNLAVERALKRRGVIVTEASVRRHRRNHGPV